LDDRKDMWPVKRDRNTVTREATKAH